MSNLSRFRKAFIALTGNNPFPWQEALYERFANGDFPSSCDLPTGLGKTSVIAIWLIALAENPVNVPRRLVYIVNRRTVVDQATEETRRIRDRLTASDRSAVLADLANRLAALAADPTAGPLAISTLRGQFADNGEWRADPARPAVVIGTIDMIGSRLLFSGYGLGFKSRPLHAGFLGQDALIVHDEAHLEPAFQELLVAIEAEQQRCREFRHLRVMELTATSRSGKEQFGLTSDDLDHAVVQKRIRAKKAIAFHAVDDEKRTADRVAELALEHKDSGHAILVFVRKLDDVDKVAERLRKAKMPVERLTGTLRGKERDELVTRPVFQRFLPPPKEGEERMPAEGTVYLICTSAGEVGVNISAGHLACDLTPYDSMTQRLGRVNRFGDGDARIDVVHPSTFDVDKDPGGYEARRAKTFDLLRKLPKRGEGRGDASPTALAKLPRDERAAAFTPMPVILPVTDILFDVWAMTSVNPPLVPEPLPGRPPVADWLHGIAGWEPSETQVAWRREVEIITGELLEKYQPEDLLDDYPLKPHELLRGRTDRVFQELMELARGEGEAPVWVIDQRGQVRVTTLGKIAEDRKEALNGVTVLLPPTAGGLRSGMLDGSATSDDTRCDDCDVADEWFDDDNRSRRRRIWDEEPAPEEMRLVREIDIRPDADDTGEEEGNTSVRRYWRWYVRPRSADDDGSRSAQEEQQLDSHLGDSETLAQRIVAALGLQQSIEGTAVQLAAKCHDLGKRRAVWQKSIRNDEYPKKVLAKSGNRKRPIDLGGYRHEFGSLIDIRNDTEFTNQPDEVRELVLHLLAAHHGRARPHFPADEAFDRESAVEVAAQLAPQIPRRYARLQRKYGRWGLAFLESLVRAADILASTSKEGSL
jgi:CRISPR-associated endonuclease/helicase Cas3